MFKRNDKEMDIPDIQSDEVGHRKDVVTTDSHSQVGDCNIFETAHHSGRQRRIILSA